MTKLVLVTLRGRVEEVGDSRKRKRINEFKRVEKAVDYSDWFSHPCAQKAGRVWFECSSIGWI
ncbi:hypothetical protein KY290_021813 [Solanum tuberosum]|uniref:Uncharacterized protein n=1 Tax=Solanum tuberosum TaxID=4113 RepID=A0ABQ7V5Q4_SOLTU|nr:hypothetical protein KY289_020977 [Solanum tuberosum]KAH0693608.1 hypothetical protein KY285_020705 [Solanum tuberosum]KAH0758320.1 hypothetical protein KY290_021813 [Solanum tuberosum]